MLKGVNKKNIIKYSENGNIYLDHIINLYYEDSALWNKNLAIYPNVYIDRMF